MGKFHRITALIRRSNFYAKIIKTPFPLEPKQARAHSSNLTSSSYSTPPPPLVFSSKSIQTRPTRRKTCCYKICPARYNPTISFGAENCVIFSLEGINLPACGADKLYSARGCSDRISSRVRKGPEAHGRVRGYTILYL